MGRPRVAAVFPGQGAQYVGMGRDLVAAYPEARIWYETANQVLGYDLAALCFSGPEDELTLTRHAQPAILTTSIAFWETLKRRTAWRPDYVAGHSLGEYTALVAAGSLPFETAVRLVHERGRLMQEAVPPGMGTMAAVLGVPEDVVLEVCRELDTADAVVQPANFNAPGQVVIAGHRAAVEQAAQRLKQHRAKVIFLKVSAPFHTRLMRPAAEQLAPHLDRAPWSDPQIPWVSNVTAQPVTRADEARELMKRQITAPVRWAQLVQTLCNLGVDHFVEIGPGSVLTGLIRRVDRTLICMNVNSVATLDQFVAWTQDPANRSDPG